MSKNRKNESNGGRFGPALKAVAICFMLGGSAIGYVGQKNEIYALGADVQKLEQRRDSLAREGENLGRILAGLQTPSQIKARVEEMELGLAQLSPDKIVTLNEPAPVGAVIAPFSREQAAHFAHINTIQWRR